MQTILIPSRHPEFAAMVAYGIRKFDKNVKIIYVAIHVEFPAARFSSSIDKFYYCSSKENQLKFLIDIIKENQVDLFYPVDEDEILFTIQNFKEINKVTSVVRLASEESFIIASNKWKLSSFLVTQDCNVAKGARQNDQNQLQYPILAKDVNGSFGKGITLLRDESEYMEYDSENKDVFFEEFIEGYDLVCNVYCQDGEILAHTILKPKYFGDKGFTSKYDQHVFAPNPRVLKLVAQCIKALNWNGIGSLDIRYDVDKDRYVIIEMNPRYWATLISSVEMGVNFPYIMMLDKVEKNMHSDIKDEKVFYSLRYLLKNESFLKKLSALKKSDLNYRLHNLKSTFHSVQRILKKRYS